MNRNRKLRTLYLTGACLTVSLVLQGCFGKQSAISVDQDAAESAPPQPVVLVKPEIDYSREAPDCITAGQRLAANVVGGMPLNEVLRLVGKPVYKFPGSWWWSRGLSKTGKPNIQYDFIAVSKGDSVVKTISSDTSGCPQE